YEKEDGYKDVVIPTPTPYKEMIFVTAGFNSGSDLIKISVDGKTIKAESALDDKKAEALEKLDNREGGVIIVDGFLFGHFERKVGLACVDLKSGETVWSSDSVKRGSIIYADGRLYYYNSEPPKGSAPVEVLLVEAATEDAKF